MGHRVIGLTRSGSKVRAAVVETRLRKFELKTVLEIELAPVQAQHGEEAGEAAAEPQFETVAAAINRMLVPGLNPSDSLVTAFPGDAGFIRRLSFPFKDRARIAEVLPIELGGTLPTGLDVELHTNFERTGDEGNEIIAVGVHKDAFASYLESWRNSGIEPGHVGMESLELAAYLPYLAGEDHEGANVLLIWVEDKSVEFLVARGTAVVFCRAVSLDRGVISGSEINGAFMREVLLSVAAASESGAPLDRAYVCGEAADAVAEMLSESLAIECSVLDPAKIGIPGAENCAGLDTMMTRPVALAIGVADGSGPAVLNLRTGEFGSEGAAGLLREKARFFTIAAIVFLTIGVAWTTMRYVGLVNDRKAAENQLLQVSSTILEKEVTDFDAALREVRAGAREELALFPEWTAVGTLEKITRSILAAGPAGTRPAPAAGAAGEGAAADGSAGEGAAGAGDEAQEGDASGDPGYAMELETIRIEPKQATMKGEAESIEKVDELMGRLKADTCFHEIVTESTERIQFQRHQGWQRFSIRMGVDCAPPQKETKKAATADAAAAEPVAEE